jgi:hypothetical protein
MMTPMRKKLLSLVLALCVFAVVPVSARADDQPNTPKDYDGRLDNFGKNVTLDNGGAALTYFVWAGLGVLATIGLFKDAKRSHLD